MSTRQAILIASCGALLALFGCWGALSIGEYGLALLAFAVGFFFFVFGGVIIVSRLVDRRRRRGMAGTAEELQD